MLVRYDWTVHGHNPDVGTAEEDIWSPGGSLVYPTAATVAACVSSDVDDTNSLTDEIQSLSNDASGGDFLIIFEGQTTAAIAYNAADTVVKAALELLSNITTVSVSGIGTAGDPWLIVFNDPGGEDVSEITTNDAGLTAGTSTIATPTPGVGGGARKIMLRGWVQTTWELETQVILMNGTAPVNSVKLWERILSAEVVASGRNMTADGDIDISLDGKVQARIEAGRALSTGAMITIPKGYHGQVTVIRTTKDGTDLHTVQLYARRKGGLTFLPVGIPLSVDNDRQNVWNFDPARSDYLKFGAETDLVLRAIAGTAGDDLDASFDITLVKNPPF